MAGIPLVPAINSSVPNPIDVLKADMKKHPENTALDEQELALEEEMQKLFLSGDSSGKYDQLQWQEMLLEKGREDKTGKTLLETPDELNNSLLCYLVAKIRETNPNFAPMGTEEGEAALADLQKIIDRM
ncbi:MAG TPA: hypothetical protein VLE89_01280 [Chlamydiales bacterium]|nr:hypothetical protein [Chlamydiales bacterium]